MGGGFYGGECLSLGGGILWRPSVHLLFRREADRNRVEIPGAGAIATNIYALRAQLIPSTRLITGAFIQYNGATEELISNVRLDWIHAPLSDLLHGVERAPGHGVGHDAGEGSQSEGDTPHLVVMDGSPLSG